MHCSCLEFNTVSSSGAASLTGSLLSTMTLSDVSSTLGLLALKKKIISFSNYIPLILSLMHFVLCVFILMEFTLNCQHILLVLSDFLVLSCCLMLSEDSMSTSDILSCQSQSSFYWMIHSPTLTTHFL